MQKGQAGMAGIFLAHVSGIKATKASRRPPTLAVWLRGARESAARTLP